MKGIAIICGVLVASTASAEVHHVPPTAAKGGAALELELGSTVPTATLVVHYRTRGQTAFMDLPVARRVDGTWIATLPDTAMVEPGVEYYVTSDGAPAFATPQWPHPLAITIDEDDRRRARDARRVEDRRYRIRALGEWVEFGSKQGPGGNLHDRYYRFDVDIAYRLWAYPLQEIRAGYTRLLGETLQDPTEMCPTPDPCTFDAGTRVAGWIELGLAPMEGVHLDGRVIAMATADGFAVGARGEGRLGDRDGSHVALGAEYLADIGASGFFRLGWGTVPSLPMAATVEITNLPASHREVGVRLYYDIAHEVYAGVRLGLRVGYAARNQSVAGFTGGAGATVEF